MVVGFRGFLGALVVIGLGLGAAFGLGVAVGDGKPAPAAASATGGVTGAAAAAAATGAGGAAAQGGGAGAFGGALAAAGQAITGTVDSVTPSSLVVRAADGSTVTLALTEQTVIRKTEAGTVQDLRAGVQVLATRDGAANATSVQLVPAGTTLPALGGGARGAGAGANASATPGARATPAR